jgi:hypothetical protein
MKAAKMNAPINTAVARKIRARKNRGIGEITRSD